MSKRINFFDGAQSNTTPVINSIQASDLSKYANDAAYQAANAGSPVGGNIYYNTTTDKIRYYDDLTNAWVNVLDSQLLGAASGIATLDGSGKIPSGQLPSYVDDVEEYANLASFPVTGETGKIYVAINTNFTYRWTGSVYVQISASPVSSVNGETGVVSLSLHDLDNVTETSTAAREFLRRNDGNTQWENFNLDSSANDTTTGANQTLATVTASVVRLTNNGLSSVDMIPAGFSGQKFVLINATTVQVDISDETGATAANRILTGTGDIITLEPDANLWLTYDATTARWRVVGGSGATAPLTGNRAVATDASGLLVASTTTDTELGYVNGVTSSIQTQLNGKEPSITTLSIAKGGTNSSTALNNNRVMRSSAGAIVEAAAITASRALESDANGIPVASATTATELSYVNGVTSAIQTQLNARIEESLVTAKGDLIGASGSGVPVRVPVGTNGQVLVANSATSEGVEYQRINLNQPNIITGNNSSFEDTIGDWVAYADAAGLQPVDGTGGSPTVTFTRITSNMLNGAGSGRLTKDAANRQGEGASLTISVPLYLRGAPVKIQFSVNGSANFDFGSPFDSSDPSDVTFYLYDVTNSKLLQPYPYTVMANGIAEGYIQIPSECVSLRLILHVTTTNAASWTLDVDDFNISAALNENVSADSNAQEYTPTFTGLGTVTNVKIYQQKMGDKLLVFGRAQVGTPTATEARISLPAGLVTPSTLSTLDSVGYYKRNANGASTADTTGEILIEPSIGYMTLSSSASTRTWDLKANGSTAFSTGDEFTIFALIPIQGWTSGNRTAASANLNAPVVFSAYKNGGAVTANAVIASWTAKTIDTVNGFNLSTGIYTVKVPADYVLNAKFTQNVGSGTAQDLLSVYINGTQYKRGIDGYSGDTSISCILPNLKVGDTIDIRNNASRTTEANNIDTFFDLHKIETSGRVYSTRVAYIKDEKSSATAGGTFTSGSYTTRVLNTLSGDTSFVSLSANQFVLQAGTYQIKASAPAYRVDAHKIKLRNITDSSDAIIGQSAFSDNAFDGNDEASLEGVISITSAKTFEIQHRCQTTQATDGLGSSCGFGDVEVYATIKIEKVL